MDSSEGLKRIKNEYDNLNRKPIVNLGFTVGLFDYDDFYRWRFTFQGPYDSPYISGIFTLGITFPKDYPNNAPQIHFLTPIYHLNVCPHKSSLGLICPNFIKNWNPSITIEKIITKLFALFYKVNPDSAFDKEMANEYLNNRPLYESKAQYFTKKYARLGKYELNKVWNFSCNESDLSSYSHCEDNNLDIFNTYYGNEQSVNIEILINGISEKVSIQCQLKELFKDVFNRFLNKYQYKFNGEILIMDLKKKLNMNYQVGYIWQSEVTILVIDISDLEFLK